MTSRVPLVKRIPHGTWDTHMHVIDPITFPPAANTYQGSRAHSLAEAQTKLAPLGISNMIVVQPSFFKTNNACTLAALEQLGPDQGRAVVQFDPNTTSAVQIRQWHRLGVRGVRLNFKSLDQSVELDTLTASLRAYADALRLVDWTLDLHIGMEDMPVLEAAVGQLGPLKLCIDHIGRPSGQVLDTADAVHDIPGFASLIRMLHRGHTWIKLSAWYRLSLDPNHALVKKLVCALVRARPDRCLFATDWPHTRFDQLDVEPYLHAVLDCIEAENVPLEQVLVTNARCLFDCA